MSKKWTKQELEFFVDTPAPFLAARSREDVSEESVTTLCKRLPGALYPFGTFCRRASKSNYCKEKCTYNCQYRT